jgi:uncharacterized protein (DUF58 family)
VRNLARAQLGPGLPFEHLKYFPIRLFPRRSFLVVISPVGIHDDETYAHLRAFGYEILLISPDAVDQIRQMLPRTEINGLAVRAARIERIIQLKRLMKLGVHVMDWQISKPFEPIFQETVKYLTHRRNIQSD